MSSAAIVKFGCDGWPYRKVDERPSTNHLKSIIEEWKNTVVLLPTTYARRADWIFGWQYGRYRNKPKYHVNM